MTTLEERIDQQLAGLDAEASIYARHLTSRQEIAIDADAVVNTLSTIKLPVMVLAFRDAEAGLLDLDERHTLAPGEFRRGSGLLQTFSPGLQPTYRDLVTQMIVTSDNTATDLLIGRLGRERVNQLLADRGYRATRLQTTTGDLFRRLLELADPAAGALAPEEVYRRSFPRDADAPRRAFTFLDDADEWLGRTTAREMARLLEELVGGQLASPASSEAMQDILRRQFYSTRLPRLIDDRVAIGHKTGDWAPIAGHDVGILYSQSGPIVIALFISRNRGPFAAVEMAHSAIAEAILDHWGAG
jgi:beta-lactamase class A